MNNSTELQLWCLLARTRGFGIKAILPLQEHFGTLNQALNHWKCGSPEWQAGLETCGIKSTRLPPFNALPWELAHQDLSWLEKGPNRHIIPYISEHYPPLLKEIHRPPPVLFVEGNLKLLKTPQIAMVGARRATPSALETASWLASELVKGGLTITSGLALGIDGACHRGALEAQGLTLGVLGTGIDVPYPLRHKKLAREIAQHGALVSEFGTGQPAQAENFPRRNRIISGLSLGVVVVEASLRSGSLITAHYGLEQGREVFAVPGDLRNPLSIGPNTLIQQGAQLVTSGADVLFNLGFHCPSTPPEQFPSPIKVTEPLNFEANLLLSKLDYNPISPDGLVRRTGMPVMKIAALLGELQLAGRVHRTPKGYVKQP